MYIYLFQRTVLLHCTFEGIRVLFGLNGLEDDLRNSRAEGRNIRNGRTQNFIASYPCARKPLGRDPD